MIEDYSTYQFQPREYITITVLSAGICIGVATLFYRSLFFSILVSPIGIMVYKKYRSYKIRKREEQLSMQFKDALIMIASSIEAGYSMEHAIKRTFEDIQTLYEKSSYIVEELKRINALILNNTTVAEAIEQFAVRSCQEDIQNFSQVYKTAQESGGNLVGIMHGTSKTIAEKYEITKEIQTMITAKKLEVSIMKIIPFGILLYLNLCSPEFLSPLYGNLFGIGFMTAMLLLICSLCLLADKIMDIEV